jgi:hypothetical protein
MRCKTAIKSNEIDSGESGILLANPRGLIPELIA